MMISTSNEIYSDQTESENANSELVRQLDENEKTKSENVNNLEELLRKSRQLNSSKSIRLIDQQITKLPTKKSENLKNLILSCNKLDQIDWTHLPNHLQSLDLSGNFVQSLDGIEKTNNELESLSLAFNEINQINEIFSNSKWLNLCLLDLSYNLLTDLKKTIQSLQNLNKLRILFLHGNPLSLLVDYRLYVVDSLEKLNVLDDITITAEERFRSRHFARSNQHPKDYSQFQITFGTIENVPMPIPSQNEWPIQIHRYKMRINWFEGEQQDIEIPFDKLADFNRFNKTFIESSNSEYKSTIDFSPSKLNFSINSLIPFRDFLFHGTTCRFIHQLTEYWPPEETTNQPNDQKKKANSSLEKDKKSDSPPKKKKNEDLSKLIIRKDPEEIILAEFNVDLRPFLDGDYQVSFAFKSLLQQQIDSNNQQLTQIKPTKKKDLTKTESPNEKKRTSSSKSNKDKPKDKKLQNENSNDPPPLPEPFQCSIHFQLQRYVAEKQII